MPARAPAIRYTTGAILCLLMGTCQRAPPILDQIRTLGELRVVTRNSPTSYYLGADGPEGPEYDLIQQFAADLGVPVYVYTVPGFADIRDQITKGRAHIAAAGLTVSDTWGGAVTFGPPYQQVRQHLIYRQGSPKPRSLEDINGTHLEVAAGSAQAATLRRVRDRFPDLAWVERARGDSLELLGDVAEGSIDYTIADSTEFALGRNFHSAARVGFDLMAGESLAWAMNARDDSLKRRVSRFFADITHSGSLAAVLDRYYGKSDRFEFVGPRSFLRDVQTRLPRYRGWFEEAATAVGEDWRLIAAIGYQESHWRPDAVSPTGVRGLMMLTVDTARHIGVADRVDPRQSIFGGARYYALVRAKIPKRVADPDRTWLALAAYNVGYGHLEDARVLTQMHGRNPDSWQDVRAFLPLLAQEYWYKQTDHGYARGWEPVRYVDNIRAYLDILEWVAADSGPQAVSNDGRPRTAAPVKTSS
ncbi:MAG: membrane-bound lytic murein transglycosylase MltF [Gemmatimonadetes bacterium]|nr:membrane-bound lytic murein transglycosylase MltF [Gemmatimonadota bacterium]